MLRTLPFVTPLSFASKMEEDLENFFIPLTFHRKKKYIMVRFKIQNRGFLEKQPVHS